MRDLNEKKKEKKPPLMMTAARNRVMGKKTLADLACREGRSRVMRPCLIRVQIWGGGWCCQFPDTNDWQ